MLMIMVYILCQEYIVHAYRIHVYSHTCEYDIDVNILIMFYRIHVHMWHVVTYCTHANSIQKGNHGLAVVNCSWACIDEIDYRKMKSGGER